MPGKRVLIVDDDLHIREVVTVALSDEGYDVITASDGAAALDIAVDRPPDLILLDLRMPGVDGGTFCQLYGQTAGPHAPIVVLTAGRDAVEQPGDLEVIGVLPKPFGLDDLLDVVGRYVR